MQPSDHKPLINKVANSQLITIDLESFIPDVPLARFDMADYLFQGLILKEKDFRAELKALDWSTYRDRVLLVYCSADAIIPLWAYMLVTSLARPYTYKIFFGKEREYYVDVISSALNDLDVEAYRHQRIVVKGCGKKNLSAGVYVKITEKLQPVVKSIMFGEPCSTVPVYKRKE